MARVALLDAGGINPATIAEIVDAASLPSGDVCLLVGDPDLDGDRQAVCIARELIPPGSHIFGLGRHLEREWDCGVIVGTRWSQRQDEFPAYFAYLLGHELGHATTVLSDLLLAAFEDLVLRHIKEASEGAITRWDQLPYERRYDLFGIAICERVYGPEALDSEFERIRREKLTEDTPRIERLLEAEGRIDLQGLGAELADFTSPYREALLALWEEERADAERPGGRPRMASRVVDLTALWSDEEGPRE